MATSRVEVEGLQVSYYAPGIGQMHFDWDGPLTVDGKEIALRDYPRWKNPYAAAEFNTGKVEIKFNGHHPDPGFCQRGAHCRLNLVLAAKTGGR